MLEQQGRAAKEASYALATMSSAQKNAALEEIAQVLTKYESEILTENAKDIEAARAKGLTEALLDRLLLTSERLRGIINDIRQVVLLPDPVGKESDGQVLENGLRLSKRRVPIGVIGVIYEARPNVTVDITSLCLKTGNAAILRGGSETIHSNRILVRLIQQALGQSGLPSDAIQFIDSPDRKLVSELLRMDQYVDMLIPRGGSGLHQLCKEQSTIPVITGGMGICHLFVEQSADIDKAIPVLINAKVHRPSACNALDTILVHRPIAKALFAKLADEINTHAIQVQATEDTQPLLEEAGVQRLALAGKDDFSTEWLSLTLGIKLVHDIDEAIDHIRHHSFGHSDGILTENWTQALRFMNSVDSAAVYVNSSTRFTDGGQFGLGAEVAVSTQKLHARGPMGLEELTTYKWIGIGDGLIRS
ncbi:glutamate-5-semialdehyde dehydrogenase [Algicola sagamiensis]|uniref:glutamate-5-semialdehyde dehydrogenase n=1 Tax=Algicola sagamiensis TaxID=163869 RepID=UPI0003657B96|nr:glutamate-5-semialdehyde dehydrogenase [Algicola sagamiensis]